MTMNTDGASPSIELTYATVNLTKLFNPNYYLEVRYKLSARTSADPELSLFDRRDSVVRVRRFQLKESFLNLDTMEHVIALSWRGLERNYVYSAPIFRVQVSIPDFTDSKIRNCDVVFPEIVSSVSVARSEELTVSWDEAGTFDNFNTSPNLYYLEELSAGSAIQRQSRQVAPMFENKVMTITPDAAIRTAGLFQCRNTLSYGNPEGAADLYLLSNDWSKPVSVIEKAVTITSVICGKAANGKFTLEVKWQNSTTLFPVRVIVRSGTVETSSQSSQAGTSSFTFPDLDLEPKKTYTVCALYQKDAAKGPESEPIPVLHGIPPKFNLNYYENGGQTTLEARWEKLAQECMYRVVATRDDVAGDPVETSAGPVSLGTDTANTGKRITGTIRAVKGISSGPLSDPVPAPYVSKSEFVFDDLGRLREVLDAGTKQQTIFTFDERGNITDRTSVRK
jgi:hypothetical protein